MYKMFYLTIEDENIKRVFCVHVYVYEHVCVRLSVHCVYTLLVHTCVWMFVCDHKSSLKYT